MIKYGSGTGPRVEVGLRIPVHTRLGTYQLALSYGIQNFGGLFLGLRSSIIKALAA